MDREIPRLQARLDELNKLPRFRMRRTPVPALTVFTVSRRRSLSR
jgi:hypothetical protein